MAVSTPAGSTARRSRQLIEREEQVLNERTKGSGEMYERAKHSLSGGVASSYQLRDPWPIYLERGDGPHVWDVDGNEYYDFHNGFGSMVQGHAHPAIGKAITERYALGTHFAAPTEDAIVVGEELSRAGACRAGATRTPAPSRRWTRSGSPARTRSARRS